MILTNCAACAAPLALDAPRCVRCQTRTVYARTLYFDPTATLDDLREAVATLEETVRIARRVLGGAHPNVGAGEVLLREARAALSAHLVVQGNLAASYAMRGQNEQALNMFRDVYSGLLRLNGEEHPHTLQAANNYAASLIKLERYEEARSLLRTMLPVARRVLGESNDLTLGLRTNYAQSLYFDAAATLNDLREAVTTLADTERIARRVFGGAHPTTTGVAYDLREARAALRARERGDVDVESIREAVAAMTAEEARALLSALETPPTTT